ncbi:MAG: hypothetical protein FWG43_03530, partial [Clostridiales bacterium]|nr:hypothetical protein [Clostridiales bacterium]
VQLALGETTLAARLAGVGRLNHEDALKYGAVGPVARAANVHTDIRAEDPYAAYDDIPVKVITSELGDVFSRTVVRVLEIQESINMIRFALDNLPDDGITVKAPRRVPEGEAISRTEAPRGEDMHYIRANGTDKPDRVRVRAASEANWHGMAHMLEGDYLADIPIIIAAIDPCYSCTDRAFVLNKDNGEQTVWDWQRLRAYSIEWYKNRGIDIAKIKIRN